MNIEEIEIRLKKIIEYELGMNTEKINSLSRFREDIELDCLDAVELIIAVEEEFDLSISDIEAERLLTFGDAVNYLTDRLQ